MKAVKKCLFVFGCLVVLFSNIQAKELTVMVSGGFYAAYEGLINSFEKKEGVKIKTLRSPSMGNTPQAIPNRLKNGEKADVVIMVGSALDKLEKQGWILKDSRVELADSPIGAVIKKGKPLISIKTDAELRKVLLNASSIAYSDSASGRYISEQLFKKLGIERQVKDKAYMIPRIPVASVIAKGAYEIGFQQVSEILPIAGITFIGELPKNLQHFTRFAGAVVATSHSPIEAKELLKYLSSKEVQNIVHSTGLCSIKHSTLKSLMK
ncbi:substrate-binding domain-containing protein [Helicobacter cappadocius]|uniref:Substrate-binding domain-containing protein n=1 Tax=Helicobacter cappadocius TaxID=3063998 RepID=A0AA90PL31_9HELI|nr:MULTISPECIES: substrate-binding domain-containing protein [unclassified Helicobacter]MDO7252931.1 substrate-binding domain-containing protein [Helicobacter sp. faydin-H75]MDP2539079.1 substrate-binding domain-containing protein [Helicobacter sp. faydin-H76]